MSKKLYTKAICKNDRLGLEVGIKINREYLILGRTNRYITIKNDYGVVTRYHKCMFRFE